MNLTQSSKGRLLQIKQGYKADGIPNFENGEFGLVLDEGQEELWIGSNSGNIQVLTERNIAQLAVPDGSIGRAELDGEVNTLLDNIGSATNIPEATTSQKGLMGSADKIKLNSIESGANNTTIVNNLTSLSTTSALSAYQGKLLKDAIDNIGGGGGGSTVAVVDNLTSTDTASALSANQGRVIKELIDNKADKTTATTTKNGLFSAEDKQKLDNLSATGGTTVVNTLTSTSTTDALSAYQGRYLNNVKLSGYQSSNTTVTESTAIGRSNTVNGGTSIALGYYNSVLGNQSTAIGATNTVSGWRATAIGYLNSSEGTCSIATGHGSDAYNFGSFSMGVSSKMTRSSGDSYVGTADALVIGNGGATGFTESNAFRVTFDGKVYGRSAYNSSGADYAEMFEWSDDNIKEEDRVGYFVTLDGDKIRKANSNDDYILGIISANPSVLGDAFSEGWIGEYVKDDFGRIQYHWVETEIENENGENDTVKEYVPVYNPSYNPQSEYTPREDRKEWDAVGMMGKLLVRDDGTCKVNGYCKPNDDGVATKTTANSNIKYRVMKRVSDNIIQVLVK